jgi:hypothetical protein
MLPQVKLVGQVAFDTRAFYGDLSVALGREVTAPIDSVNADATEPSSLLVAICEMLNQGQNYYKILKNPGSATHHLFFVFFAAAVRDHSSEFAQHTNLKCHCVLAKHNIYIHLISGTLEEWRSTVINCSSEVVDCNFRALINQFMLEFESLGLKDLWFAYSKQQLPDSTIKLIGYK